MTIKIKLFVSLILAVFLYSCSTKIDLTDEYKETLIVYALLNEKDSIHFVKINKAFLGSGNNLEYAQQPDSFNIIASNYDIILEQVRRNEVIGTIALKDTIVNRGNSGVFSKERNQVFFTRQKLVTKADNLPITYRLKITNKLSGEITSAETRLVDISFFNLPSSIFNPVRPDGAYNLINLAWIPVENAKLYNLQLYFYFTDYAGSKITSRFITWNLGDAVAETGTGVREVRIGFRGDDFFSYLKSRKQDVFHDDVSYRIADSVKYFLSVGGTEFYNYKQVYGVTSGLLLDKPIYTNVTNGVGLFSSRSGILSAASLFSDRSNEEMKTLGLKFD